MEGVCLFRAVSISYDLASVEGHNFIAFQIELML
jgi:hypothetical protein